MGKQTDIGGILANLPLFQQLSEDEIVGLAAGTRAIRLRKGQILFQTGSLLEGLRRRARSDQIGVFLAARQRKVVSIVEPGQSFGEAMMFMENPARYSLRRWRIPACCTSPSKASSRRSIATAPRPPDAGRLEHPPAWTDRGCGELFPALLHPAADRISVAIGRSLGQWFRYLRAAGQQARHRLAAESNAGNVVPDTAWFAEMGLVEVKGRSITVLDIDRPSRFDQAPRAS